MVAFRRRSEVAAAKEQVNQIGTPPPTNPAELGLALRAARERRRLTLEEVRDLIDVPVVDVDALEQGQLALFHLQQAAVVALWRYAALVGLDPDRLLPVLQAHWPHRSLSVTSLRGEDLTATPVARLTAAARLLAPMLRPLDAISAGSLGLSRATQAELTSGSAVNTFAASVLIPAAAAAAHGAALASRRPAVPRRRLPPPGGATPAVPPPPGPPGDDEPASLRPEDRTPPRPAPAPPVAEIRPERPARGEQVDPEPRMVEQRPPDRRTVDRRTVDAPIDRLPAIGQAGPPLASLTSAMQRSWRYAGHLRHVVAERFGMDEPGALSKAAGGRTT